MTCSPSTLAPLLTPYSIVPSSAGGVSDIYYYVFVFTILAFVLIRGIRLARASGFGFYQYADFALAAALATSFGVSLIPAFAATAAGEPNTALPWWIMGGGFVASAVISFQGQRRAMLEQPERWRKWAQIRAKMSLFDRLAGRYPEIDRK
jgi:hypothetical protein